MNGFIDQHCDTYGVEPICKVLQVAPSDGKTMFINVQHPGEVGSHPNRPTTPAGVSMDDYIAVNPLAFSHWPEAEGGRPRSATVVITKLDGGVIGT